MNLTRLLILLLFVVSACTSSEYIVDSDYSYDGSFNKYKSFGFADNTGFLGSDEEKEVIEKYLKRTLQAWGYDYNLKRPNLLVFYTIYYDDLEFPGYNQPHFQSWLKSNYSDKEIVFKKDTLPDGRLREAYADSQRGWDEEYNRISYDLKEGTLLISLFDRRKHKTVWNGYASGVFGNDETKNARIMRSAIIRILDEYKLLAFGSS